MEIRVQSIHFNATEKLQAFIEKKVGKFAKSCEDGKAEVVLKVVKPETVVEIIKEMFTGAKAKFVPANIAAFEGGMACIK